VKSYIAVEIVQWSDVAGQRTSTKEQSQQQ